jgi:hypothetical protein
MITKSLTRLRAKTDRELAILVTKQLHRSRKLARAGEDREAASGYVLAEKLLKVAAMAPAEAARLEKLRSEVRQLIELPATATA